MLYYTLGKLKGENHEHEEPQVILNWCFALKSKYKKRKAVSSNMEGTSLLVWGIIFGAIGLGFFTYGRRQQAVVPLITGIALFVFPYFISNVYILVFVGVLLIGLPYFVRI